MSVYESASAWPITTEMGEHASIFESPFAVPEGEVAEAGPWASEIARTAGPGESLIVTVVGTKQGTFKGDVEKPKGGIRANIVGYAVTSPRDAATGMALGKRQHQPVVFEHAVGPSSPQFLQALVTNEELKSVKLVFSRAGATGQHSAFYIIDLDSAAVAGIRFTRRGTATVEEVAVVFRTITVNSTVGNTMAADHWASPTA